MLLFEGLKDKIHQIDDLILGDLVEAGNEDTLQSVGFHEHLYSTKCWFLSISWVNKKRFLLGLLQDLKNAWALAYLLKSIWNCRLKDSVMSAYENLSSYDLVPLDTNRTAQPVKALIEVVKSERQWFITLNASGQYLVMADLLAMSGGPIMWEVLREAQKIYDTYHTQLLNHVKDNIVVADSNGDKAKNLGNNLKNPGASTVKLDTTHPQQTSLQTSKELEMQLTSWRNTTKQMRDVMKLEEIEMTFSDGSKNKIWKINRTKPESLETVDFIQLLPSQVALRIFSYLPRAQFGDYAKVNSYWAYLLEEFKAEVNARMKLNTDLEILKATLRKHETNFEMLSYLDTSASSQCLTSVTATSTRRKIPCNLKQSEKPGGPTFKHLLNKQPKRIPIQKPIGKVNDLSGRLNQRGSVDENIWLWCKTVLKQDGFVTKTNRKSLADVTLEEKNHFPCPLMRKNIKVPLETPLVKDPIETFTARHKKKVETVAQEETTKDDNAIQRYSFWTRDFTGLYPVFKVLSYESPI